MNDKKQSILFSLLGDSNKASSRVRGFWIAEELEKEGFNCTLRWKRGKLALLKLAYEILLHDIIIFQKTQSRYHRWLMALANKLGKRTYLDIDDAPSRINSPVTLANLESMLRMSDGVFAGNSNLLKYTKQHQGPFLGQIFDSFRSNGAILCCEAPTGVLGVRKRRRQTILKLTRAFRLYQLTTL